MNRLRLSRNPRFRKFANSLLLIVPFFMACFSTVESIPDLGKSWRPLLVAQIVVAWLAFLIGAWAWRQNERKQRTTQYPAEE